MAQEWGWGSTISSWLKMGPQGGATTSAPAKSYGKGVFATGMAVEAGTTLISAYMEREAIKEKEKFERMIHEGNIRMANLYAKDAIKRGKREAERYGQRVKRLIGSQRVALAAQGIEVGEGTALEIQADTAAQAAEDMLTIKNNAWREAFGYRVEAMNLRGQAAMGRLAARAQARDTLLTGGLMAARGMARSAMAYEYPSRYTRNR